jgi:hypothetical protein
MIRSTILIAFVVTACLGTTRGQEKDTDAQVKKIDAYRFATEFQTNAKEARQKYGAKGEAPVVEISGLVAGVNSRTRAVTMDTGGAKVSVVLQAKKITGPDQKSKQMAVQAVGKFKSFDRNTVVLECDEVVLLRVIGDKKGK